ncbi:hypothetical protein V8E53_013876 [Lactarius tabidus]
MATMQVRRFNAAPRWSGLIHFGEVVGLTFSDGTKFEDISKILVFAVHNIIPRTDKCRWLLLCAVRSFTIVDLYLSFEEHTEHTIAAGQQELKKFASLMQKYIHESSKLPTEDFESEDDSESRGWNFLKMHALSHSFDDIEAKGATQNYNTKPNEKQGGQICKKSHGVGKFF